MKRILYLEPVGGIAGDMFLAAAIDLGVSVTDLTAALRSLPISGWTLSTSRAVRHAITGTHLDVQVGSKSPPGEERSLSEIRRLIQSAEKLSPRVRARALEVFQLIGEVEAKIHGVPIERIHFHEVGAVDSIVDICGAAVVLELLGEPEVYAAPPPLGSGTVETAHGRLPIPSPATLELLKDLPVRFEGVGELTTPTGAALLKAFCKVEPPPEFILERVGYGIGTQQLQERPNVLRASLGRSEAPVPEPTWVVEANLDDCNPQFLGSLLEGVLELGAVDSYLLPATMKKSRAGQLLGVVVPESRREAVVEALLRETTTLGVRLHRVERVVLDRSFENASTRFGTVRIKVARRQGEVVNAQPEFEDCRRIAQKEKVPIKLVWAEAVASYHQSALRGMKGLLEGSNNEREMGSSDAELSEKDR